VTRLRAALERTDQRIPGIDLPLLSVSQTRGVIRRSELTDKPPRAETLDVYKVCRAGDLVFNKMSIRAGAVGVAREDGLVTYHYEVMRARAGHDPWFLAYLMKSEAFISELVRMERGIGAGEQANVRTTEVPFSVLRLIDVLLPSLSVQRLVAAFLDRETAKIDALIAKQDALVARLREHRRSAIVHAVEAVLDPSSGARFKHFVTVMRQGWSPQCESVPADGVTEWGVLKTGCVNGGVFRPEENKMLPSDVEPRVDTVVRRGEIVISRASTRELVGSAAVVKADYPRLMLSDKTYAITVDRRVADPWFVSSFLGTPRIRQAIELEATWASHSMQNVSKEDLLNLPMPLPPVGSQVEVVRALQVDAPKVDAMVGKAQQLSAKLKERRAALITAAVTGKLDVTTYGKAG